ncbi:hypothetical protein B0H13DRAFT_1974271 [Mycena leptocephala]|nr:hypothetical protein B0H13DRAFT_1974271 [Mycena leptocephala]
MLPKSYDFSGALGTVWTCYRHIMFPPTVLGSVRRLIFSVLQQRIRTTNFIISSASQIFLAEATPVDEREGINCVVKFTSSYCEEAHLHMQGHNMAPTLLYCSREPSIGNLFVVILKYILDSPSTSLTQQSLDLFETALESLHNAGLVFGDLCRPNLLINAER